MPPISHSNIVANPPSGLTDQAADRPGDEAIWRNAMLTLRRLRAHGVQPLPRNYDMWFANPNWSDAELAARTGAATQAASCEQDSSDLNAAENAALVSDAANEIAATSQMLIDSIGSGQIALDTYGAALDGFLADAAEPMDPAVMVRGLGEMFERTTRLGQQNRALQGHLSDANRQIDKLRRSLSETRQVADTDGLTGLLNRRAFESKLRRSTLQSAGQPCSLLMADIDHFKRFNDTYGHSTGDLVLRLVACLLQQNVKGRDAVARWGGEEFCIMLVGSTVHGAEVVARQICESTARQSLVDERTKRTIEAITLSIGVAQYRPGESTDAFVQRTDAALYAAKNAGRNRVVTAGG